MWNNQDCEAVYVYEYMYMQMMKIVKQSGLWSSLGSHGYYVSTLVDCAFSLVVKLGIMKFWHFKLNLTLKVKVTPTPPKKNKNNRILTKLFCTSGPNFVILDCTVTSYGEDQLKMV